MLFSPVDFGPTLKIPKSLAVQIYYHLMEQRQSFLEQEKQKMIKEGILHCNVVSWSYYYSHLCYF